MRSFVLLFLIVAAAGQEGSLPKKRGKHSGECGLYLARESRGKGNVSVTFVEQPWLVGIYRPVGLDSDRLICEGALINARYVLTAAACVNGTRNSFFRVALGDFDIEGYTSEDRKIQRKIVHENFGKTNENEFVNDIALLELAEPVDFDVHIMPICLPEKNINFEGKTAFVMGWGALDPFRIEILQATPPELEIHVEVDSNDLCSAWFAAEYRGRIIPETAMCARPTSPEDGPCRDGSALIMKNDGRAQLIGVSSGIPPNSCGSKRDPTLYTKVLAVYTNVTNYVDWINSKLQNDSNPEVGEEEVNQKKKSLMKLRETVDDASAALVVGIVAVVAVLVVIVLTALRLLYCYNMARQLKRQLAAATSDRPKAIMLNDLM